nr:S-adenosylmethionine:tRNA ribosyltransferase-isomerase [Gammaproteobacteria bacterium]
DEVSYQTVYAEKPGSVAAPTAGLHFTPELLNQFHHTFLTLDIGLGTFRPVKSKNVEDHEMHEEHYDIPDGLAEKCDAAQRVVAVGTTVCRVLESKPKLTPGPDATSIFITPPYSFRRTDVLLTNFHLPESTLVMLVAAFGGYDLIMHAYQEAVKNDYRFYSYGDSMLIL